MISGTRIALSRIARIQLDEDDDPPPASAGGGAVVMADGTIAKGRFLSLTLGVVDTTAGELEREDVAWIVLEAARKPASHAAPKRAAAGKGMWNGTITARATGTVNGVFSQADVEIEAHFREHGQELRSEESVLRNRMTCRGAAVTCEGEMAITVTGSRSGQLQTKDGRQTYWIAVGVDNQTFPVTYRKASGTSTSQVGFLSPAIGRAPDPRTRFVENGCMKGSYTAPASGAFETIDVSWSICRE